jgi:hypothetical protein
VGCLTLFTLSFADFGCLENIPITFAIVPTSHAEALVLSRSRLEAEIVIA